ncbi:serine hydrolase [Streptomyces sp. NBC_01020]|uniref:serine hydrolase n=1 Tax=unclassified Streptomyces TaxID=2593676 RepID=UPI002E247085|nr:serine hydrolase [Streptomyces sp. NBC_01020]
MDPDAVLARALRSVAGDASLSVAVLDTATGATAAYGNGSYHTASIVKVGILATLLLRAQDAGRGPGAPELALAAPMIEHSDNASATALWKTIGGARGFDSGVRRLGLTRTRGGANGEWGLTRTTAGDQLALLRAVFGTDSELAPASRRVLAALMAQVVPGQAWGVSAAGSSWALKNGWLPRGSAARWTVNSIGRVTTGAGGRLIAVLSEGHTTLPAGIAVTGAAARAAVTATGGTG